MSKKKKEKYVYSFFSDEMCSMESKCALKKPAFDGLWNALLNVDIIEFNQQFFGGDSIANIKNINFSRYHSI